MTTIVGAVGNGRVVLACDGRITCGHTVFTQNRNKIYPHHGYFGFSGACAAIDIILDLIKVHIPKALKLDELREAFRTIKAESLLLEYTESEDEANLKDIDILYANKYGLFQIEGFLDVCEILPEDGSAYGFSSIGTGWSFAKGYMHDKLSCMEPVDLDAVVNSAIEVAKRFDMYSGGTVRMEAVKIKK